MSELAVSFDDLLQSAIEEELLLSSTTLTISLCALTAAEDRERRQKRTERKLRREIESLKEKARERDSVREQKRPRDVDADGGEAEKSKTKRHKTEMQSKINAMEVERARTLLVKIHTELPEAANLIEHEVDSATGQTTQ